MRPTSASAGNCHREHHHGRGDALLGRDVGRADAQADVVLAASAVKPKVAEAIERETARLARKRLHSRSGTRWRSRALKDQPRVVIDFFGFPTAELFCPSLVMTGQTVAQPMSAERIRQHLGLSTGGIVVMEVATEHPSAAGRSGS